MYSYRFGGWHDTIYFSATIDQNEYGGTCGAVTACTSYEGIEGAKVHSSPLYLVQRF